MCVRRLPRILIVDDQPDMIRTLSRLLTSDADIASACSGAAALTLISGGERFDLVLCDIMMPGMTGLDLFDRVKAIDPTAAAVFVFTTGGIPADQQDRLTATGARCLPKPCDIQELKRLIAGKEPLTLRGAN
jgi:CheY-like chemotaxis protein